MTSYLDDAAARLPADRRRRLAAGFAAQRDDLAAAGDHDLAALMSAVACALAEANDRERAALQALDWAPGVNVIEPGRLIE